MKVANPTRRKVGEHGADDSLFADSRSAAPRGSAGFGAILTQLRGTLGWEPQHSEIHEIVRDAWTFFQTR